MSQTNASGRPSAMQSAERRELGRHAEVREHEHGRAVVVGEPRLRHRATEPPLDEPLDEPVLRRVGDEVEPAQEPVARPVASGIAVAASPRSPR